MKLDPTQVALIALAERKNAEIEKRLAMDPGTPVNYNYQAGVCDGLRIAMSIFGDAGFPVASLEYLAGKSAV